MPTLLSGFPDGFSARDEETSGCQGERLAEQHLGWGWIPPFSVGHPPSHAVSIPLWIPGHPVPILAARHGTLQHASPAEHCE